MNIVILDDYQDAVRKLACSAKLESFQAKVYTNTVKGLGQLSVRLKDADVIVLNRERTQLSGALIAKLPRLKLVAQTGRIGSHIDVNACTEHGVAVAEGTGSPVAPAELTWALIMAATRRLPQYIGNLKHYGDFCPASPTAFIFCHFLFFANTQNCFSPPNFSTSLHNILNPSFLIISKVFFGL